MREAILNELAACEAERGVEVLLAVESGSRCWGLENEDSDYDVRFVYVRPRESYLSLKQPRDTIDWHLDDNLDVVGWDIVKFLRLLHDSNPQTFEWLESPIVYSEQERFAVIRELGPSCFNPVSNAHHYRSMAKRNMDSFVRIGSATTKRYLYCVRSVLACRWAVREQRPAPMEFDMLEESMLEPELVPTVDAIVRRKRESHEAIACDPIPELDKWLAAQLDVLGEEIAALKPPMPVGWETLDAAFLKVLS